MRISVLAARTMLTAFGALATVACSDHPLPTPPDAPSRSADVSEIGDPFSVGLKLVADGLTSPVAIVSANDGTGRLFIVDQVGLVRVLTSDGTLLPTPFLDLRSKIVPLSPGYDERGLLGLAFHPQYASNGRFFVYYSAPRRAGTAFNNLATFAEYHVSGDPNRADPASERVFLTLDDPQSNHNGGTIAFGPDGYLYMSIGDGGGANDCSPSAPPALRGTHVADWYHAFLCPDGQENGNGQDVEHNLFGNILRIDVNGPLPYGIPADNPFVGKPGLDEIYAYGFRNPYRFSFDMGGELGLLVGDAGQGRWEEVSQVVKGGNYGWNVKEGSHCFNATSSTQEPASCPSVVESGVRAGDRLIDPVIEYANAAQPGGLGVVVVGGVVYRGRNLPQLRGRYVFGDWSRSFTTPDGTLFAATPRGAGPWVIQELRITTSASGRIEHKVLGFGQDPQGEVYVGVTKNTGPTGSTGKVYKLVGPSGKEKKRK